ncbi:2,3-bisphosphoglycerate-dependent phosphoglycerate mutase [Methylorubrum extorquens]|uniref:2,3-bisphosphoglycerate-dependent phosphoglycerate mutase n=1 Tax=Methylorubrum extorquens TaxID=408 RepID=UPI00138AB86F|nr:2,3-bisphosphoglycerate-dependent phosphoglycerate mutase [Methylorubrum extorquens]
MLVRHGESEFNKQDRFTGLKDPPLTSNGVREAIEVGRTLQASGFHYDVAFTSELKRAQQSLQLILRELHARSVPVFNEAALNERNYGELAGMTRDAARARWGEERVAQWRRSYDVAPPGGESLAMTAGRTLPFFDERIRPLLSLGKRVLVVAHGNSLRSIVMSLDIFATAPSPLTAVAVREALLILQEEPDRQQRLTNLVAFTHREIGAYGGWRPSGSQILPYIVGENARAMTLASALQARGFDIRGIRPPTVPAGTARLRISLTLNVGKDDIRAMLNAVIEETRGDAR